MKKTPDPDRHVGFTGTRNGMTTPQAAAVHIALVRLRETGARFFHHGDCLGADDRAATIAHDLGYIVVAHPPNNTRARAWGYYDQIRPPHAYLVRNRHIVDECSWLIGCPATVRHELRSGTWSTIRLARDLRRRLTIVAPNGLLIDPACIGDPSSKVSTR
nr:hypothetical protein [Pseudonocardia sp. AL041005-10]